MEIKLLAYKNYNIPDFNGNVELHTLNKGQMKRLSGARDNISLFKKLLKVFSAADSPIELPKGFDVQNLDVSDLRQILIGLTVTSDARETREIITCKHCKALNPRVIDKLQVFNVIEPEIDSNGKFEIELSPVAEVKKRKSKDEAIIEQPVKKILCRYLSIGRFLNVMNIIGNLDIKTIASSEYAKLMTVNDEEDFEDLKSLIIDFGMIAECIEHPDYPLFSDRINWLSKMTSKEDNELFKKINSTILGMSSSIETTYRDKCGSCGEEISIGLEATSYFFDLG